MSGEGCACRIMSSACDYRDAHALVVRERVKSWAAFARRMPSRLRQPAESSRQTWSRIPASVPKRTLN